MSGLRLDLHIHTSASVDCRSAPADVVATAGARGLDRIAITDHDQIDGAFRCRDLDPDRIIVGEEVKTAERVDVTGLFLSEKIPGGLSAEETARAIKEQGGLVYVPHPFASGKGPGGDLLDRLAPWIDIVEVFNARIHRQELNARARRWADARGLPGGAGSDAHTLTEIGRGVVELPEFYGPDELLRSLGAGRIVGRGSGRWVHLASTWARIRSRAGL